MKRDFVAEIIDVVREVAAVDAGAQQRIEQTIRQRFGGEKLPIYTSAPMDLDAVMARVDAGLRAGKSVRQIAGEVGRDRVTIYRYIHKSCKARRQ